MTPHRKQTQRPAHYIISFGIATRQSPLALWQARWLAQELQSLGHNAHLVPLTSTGDKLQKQRLSTQNLTYMAKESKILSPFTTGKGFFIKEIQDAVYQNQAHFAVHSLKDLPLEHSPGLAVCCYFPRANPEDVLILHPQLSLLLKQQFNLTPQSPWPLVHNALSQCTPFLECALGTSSLRRLALLHDLFGTHLRTRILRGNVDSRLGRLVSGEYKAIIVARAGLERLSLWQPDHMWILPPDIFVPCAGQGVIAVETRADCALTQNIARRLSCQKTETTALKERALLKRLGGDCHSAIGSYFDGEHLHVAVQENGVLNRWRE